MLNCYKAGEIIYITYLTDCVALARHSYILVPLSQWNSDGEAVLRQVGRNFDGRIKLEVQGEK